MLSAVGVFYHHRRLFCILALVAVFVGVAAYAAQNHELPFLPSASVFLLLLSPDLKTRPHFAMERAAHNKDPFCADTPDRAPPLSRVNKFI
jgi:hypothetical protein